MNLPENAVPVERISLTAQPSAACIALHLQRYTFACQHVTAGSFVLDAACGTGYGSNLLASVPAAVCGIDNNDEALLEAAERHFTLEHPKGSLCFSKGDLFAFLTSHSDRAFDVIVSFETLEHLDNMFSVLNEMFRVAKHRVIFSFPYNEEEGAWPFHRQFRLTAPKIELAIPQEYQAKWYYQQVQPFCGILPFDEGERTPPDGEEVSSLICVAERVYGYA